MAVFSALALLVHVLQVNAAPRLVPEHGTIVGREDVSETTYDFIVAGGGISGLTVADRLTEDPDGGWAFQERGNKDVAGPHQS